VVFLGGGFGEEKHRLKNWGKERPIINISSTR
jgi:hypothetical protein